MADTIFALSSGAPPAAIGIIRISGAEAGAALDSMAGKRPEPRRAVLRRIVSPDGSVLDTALVVWFPGPDTATGEDCAEIHCHGGHAVVRAIERALGGISGLRAAQPGEFTRRAFANGRIDLAQAEGLADLLSAETELQRQAAVAAVGGSLSTRVEDWRERVLVLSAMVEAVLDFSDEDDVGSLPEVFDDQLDRLAGELRAELDRPAAERLRDGIRVVLAGPPNSGKSSLFNAMLDEGAALVSAEAGTTRDVIERPVAFEGIPFLLVDTAGLRDDGAGDVERMGIAKAESELRRADIVLWLGAEGDGPSGALEIESMADLGMPRKSAADHRVSAKSGEGLVGLVNSLVARARTLLPKPGVAALNRRQRESVAEALTAIAGIDAATHRDLLLVAEHLRAARCAFDRLLGRQSTEAMLDALFARFCIGK